MNDQPHTHTIKFDAHYGSITYGDQHEYLYLGYDHPPAYWPRWYLNWKTKRIIRKLIRQHDEGSQPALRAGTKNGQVDALVAEAQASLTTHGWGRDSAH